MLDNDLLERLKSVFAVLEQKITLVQSPSEHSQQRELRELLDSVASTSERISVVESGHPSSVPRFTLLKNNSPTGVVFRGIPGGHEFTSLILAILNADNKGKLPDAALQSRVKALRGPIRLRTFISLDCTNCPDVVQTLNLMALLHDDFQHEMWDGAMANEEVEKLAIQGVPAVFKGDTLIHVGKSNLAELLNNLEEQYGTIEDSSKTQTQYKADVAVIGGGPAGVAAAIYSARKGLKVSLIAGRLGGQVKDTLGIENLISVPYTEGPLLAEDLGKHLAKSEVQVLDNRNVEEIVDGQTKEIRLKGGEVVMTQQIIIATGAKWRELGVPGEKEYLGRGVAFCPHCDGPFYKGKRVAVIGGGNSGVEAAIDLAGICTSVVVLDFGDNLKADHVLQRKLQSLPNIEVISKARTTEIVGNGQTVTAIKWEDRSSKEIHHRELDGVFVQIGLAPNSGVVKDLVEINRAGEIVVDARNRTSRQGIYAAGDVTSKPYKQIIIAMGDGAACALAAFEDRMRGN